MYSLAEAAKATGKSKSTLTRAIKKGTIAATKNGHGQYEIEPSELHRVYPLVASGDAAQQSDDAPRNSNATPDLLNEVIRLRAEVQAKDEVIDAYKTSADDLRDRLDREGEERRQIMARLTHITELPEPRKGLLARIFS